MGSLPPRRCIEAGRTGVPPKDPPNSFHSPGWVPALIIGRRRCVWCVKSESPHKRGTPRARSHRFLDDVRRVTGESIECETCPTEGCQGHVAQRLQKKGRENCSLMCCEVENANTRDGSRRSRPWTQVSLGTDAWMGLGCSALTPGVCSTQACLISATWSTGRFGWHNGFWHTEAFLLLLSPPSCMHSRSTVLVACH